MILYVLSFREDSLPKVHVKDISSAHFISYHPDRDLLPMILYVLSFREDSLPKAHVKDISSAHLISYHPDRDLSNLCLGGNLSNEQRICPLHGPWVNCLL
jgi:hypothetical protein